MFDNVRRTRRSARVARTGATIYLSYKRTQRRVRKLSSPESDAAWEQAHTANAERIYRLAVDLKGLYVKGGQFLGTRSDVVPAPYTASLSRLQDSVPPRAVADVRATIEREFGKPISSLFASFDDTPLGAASLAQVHRAALADGRQVVVKVQYPEVGALVRLDIRNLRMLAGLVARREPNFDYRAIVNEIGTQVPLELDFVREAEMTRRIGANLSGLADVMAPRVVDTLVSGRVLVTEYIEGARLLDTERLARMDIDRARLAQTIASAYGHQILVDGLFQADPHPGNILVLDGGRVALLDFGLTKELPEASRLGFARLVVAAADRDPAAIVRAFGELGVRTKSDDPASLLALTSLFFDSRPLTERPAGIAQQRRATRQNPVEAIPGDLVLLGRVVGLLRGVSASLGSALSPMQMLRPYAEAALAAEG